MLKDDFDTSKNRKEILSADEPVTDSDNDRQRDGLSIDTAFDDGDISDLHHSESMTDLLYEQPKPKKNIRVATRFIREDIAASINIPGLLSFSKNIPVNLMDIASKGVLVSTDQRLGINKKIILTLQFESGKVFEIKGIIVRRSGLSQKEYGIKFDHYNNELGDYLLETQEKLIFK